MIFIDGASVFLYKTNELRTINSQGYDIQIFQSIK